MAGMPRGLPGPKRTKTVSVYLTPDEYDAWQARRERSGQRDLAVWIRRVVAAAERLPEQRAAGDVPPSLQVPEANRDGLRELARVGSNLNQLARAMNAGQVPDASELAAALAAVSVATRALRGQGEQGR